MFFFRLNFDVSTRHWYVIRILEQVASADTTTIEKIDMSGSSNQELCGFSLGEPSVLRIRVLDQLR